MGGAFRSPEAVRERLDAADYIASMEIATALYLADRLEKPLLVEGPPGVGKTEVGKVMAAVLGRELVRLQCYEGLDESKALYEWEYAKQLLYTQILRDKVGEILEGTRSLADAVETLSRQDSAFFSQHFLVARPLLRAIRAADPVVLLVDEIDRSDEEFEAFLLEVLSDFQVTVPELGTLRALSRPFVVLTSNAERRLSEALRRRCLYLYIDYPSADVELRILGRKVPGLDALLSERVIEHVGRLRRLELRKAPSISETIDWAMALVALAARDLSRPILRQTLSVLLKDKDDLDRAARELGA